MKESYIQGLANHNGPSYVAGGARAAAGASSPLSSVDGVMSNGHSYSD